MPSTDPSRHDGWPALPYETWKDTYATLHMWMQVVGKVALARATPLNHSWAIAFHLTARGLSTGLLTHGRRSFTIAFDFIDHQLVIDTSDGVRRTLPLSPRPVATFYREVMAALEYMGLPVRIWPVPVEVPSPVPFVDNTADGSYEPEAVARWWQILRQVHHVFAATRSGFIGKCNFIEGRVTGAGRFETAGGLVLQAGSDHAAGPAALCFRPEHSMYSQ